MTTKNTFPELIHSTLVNEVKKDKVGRNKQQGKKKQQKKNRRHQKKK